MKKRFIFIIWCIIYSIMHASLFIDSTDAALILRTVNNNESCAPSVSISLTISEDASTFALQEQIPFGLVPYNINEDGKFHPEKHEIRWGNFQKQTAKSLSYDLTGINGQYQLSEMIFSSDGYAEYLTQTTSISIQCTSTVQHPFDPDVDDIKLEPVDTPLFFIDSQTVPTYVSITSTTENVKIYYTINGSRPNKSSIPYTGTFYVAQPVKIRAIAIMTDMADSSVSEINLYSPEIQTFHSTQYVFNNDSTAPSMDVNITPSESTQTYALLLALPAGLTPYNINENGNWNSDNKSIRWGNFQDHTCRSFSFNITGASGEYIFDEIIYSENGKLYEFNQNTIVKLIRPEKEPDNNNPDDSETELIEPPVFQTTSENAPFRYSITCNTPDTVVYYTVDGTRPTEKSQIYTDPIDVYYNTKIRAIAIKNGNITSSTSMVSYPYTPGTILNNNVECEVIDNQSCKPKLNISITPETNTQSYALELFLPKNIIPSSITESGIFNYTQNSIRWGNFLDNYSRSLSFQMTGNNQSGDINGIIAFNGFTQEITTIPVEIYCSYTETVIEPEISIEQIPDITTYEDINIEIPITITNALSNSYTLYVQAYNPLLINEVEPKYFENQAQVPLIIEPAPDQFGETKVIISVTDNRGYTASTEFQLTINPVNDTPLISNINDLTIIENHPVNDIHFTVDDAESNPDELSIIVASSDTGIVPDENIIVSGSGKDKILKIIPADNVIGNVTITVSVYDKENIFSHTNFLLSINANKPPVASGSTLFFDEDRHLNILLNAYDTENDPLKYSLVSLPSNGNIILNGNIATYTPANNFNGMDTFSFKANDGFLDSNTAQIVMTIYAVDDPPVATDLSFQTIENRPYTFTFSQTDVDGDQLFYNIVNAPGHGSLSTISQDSTNYVTYTPDEWFWGTDTFIYTLSDNNNESMTATVSIEVIRSDEYVLSLECISGFGEVSINGTYVLLPWKKSFKTDSIVTINAISTPDRIFEKWSGDLDSPSSNPLTITVNQGKTLFANFVPPKRTLKLAGYQSVIINNELLSLPLEKSFYKGDTIKLKAVPENEFISWSGDISEFENPMSLDIQSDMTIIALFKDDREWAANIHAEAQNLSQSYSDEITIGASIISSTKPDNLPDEYGCSLLIYSSDWKKNSTDIRAYDGIEYSWIIAVNPHGNIGSPEQRTTVINWNPEQLSKSGTFRIYRGYDKNDEIVVSDMRNTSNFAVTGVEAVQIFNIVWSNKDIRTFYLKTKPGWNLISIPVIPNDSHINALFPDAIVYEYKNYDYHIVDELQPGRGYWLYTLQNGYNITGEPLNSYNTTLSKGWNLIGTIDGFTEDPFPKKCVEDIIYYRDGAYIFVSKLAEGNGYWVNMKKDCELILSK